MEKEVMLVVLKGKSKFDLVFVSNYGYDQTSMHVKNSNFNYLILLQPIIRPTIVCNYEDSCLIMYK